jgi:hypothetical protein
MRLSNVTLALLAGLAAGWLVFSGSGSTDAADPAAVAASSGAAPIQVVTYPSGMTGFFDPNEKMLYLYAEDLQSAVKVVQIDKLGRQLRVTNMSFRGSTQPAKK